jgi:hypothetical protein
METINVKNNVVKNETGRTIRGDFITNRPHPTTRKATVENIPLDNSQNIPLALLGQYDGSLRQKWRRQRRYTKAKKIETLAISKYRQNGRGISFKDLLSNGVATHKQQAQTTWKHCLRANILFTIHNRKPQEYYPLCLKSEILNKNIRIGATGGGLPTSPLLLGNVLDHDSLDSYQGVDCIIIQTLEGYVLPLLPKVPLHIHKMQLKVRIPPEFYHEIAFPKAPWNKGKEHEEIIGSTRARYRFYANGTVVVSTESSNNPFRLEYESDCSSLMAFLGQVRDRLVLFLSDKHERIVPDIMSWELTQWDLNKDVEIDYRAQIVGLKIQLRHACRLFRVYVKSKGRDTVCRVEESISSKNRSAVEAISDIFNPTERLEKQVSDINRKVNQLLECGAALGFPYIERGVSDFDT